MAVKGFIFRVKYALLIFVLFFGGFFVGHIEDVLLQLPIVAGLVFLAAGLIRTVEYDAYAQGVDEGRSQILLSDKHLAGLAALRRVDKQG